MGLRKDDDVVVGEFRFPPTPTMIWQAHTLAQFCRPPGYIRVSSEGMKTLMGVPGMTREPPVNPLAPVSILAWTGASLVLDDEVDDDVMVVMGSPASLRELTELAEHRERQRKSKGTPDEDAQGDPLGG